MREPHFKPDEVDMIVEGWARVRGDFDAQPLAVFSRLLRLNRYVDRMRKRVFAAHNIESWEFEMLTALRRQGAPFRLTAGKLMRQTLVSSGTVTNRIDRMVEHGLVKRLRDPEDKRIVHVQATPKGIEVVDGAMSDLLSAQQMRMAGMSEEEKRELANLLRVLLANFEYGG